MSGIDWIDEAVEDIDAEKLDSLVDTPSARDIADRELQIENAAQRVDRFVVNLPQLINWFGENYREFPWRRTRNPWNVIIAEILLQRTHASTVEMVYDSFLQRFPDPEAVVSANSNEIFRTVESLGFGNKRTRTLEALSETLIAEFEGEIPDDLEKLQELPRIGPYTTRACLCFAYGHPFALVDSNIETVVEHVFGYQSSVRAHKDDSLYRFLDALIPKASDAARVFNLALLDLRYLICGTSSVDCPLQDACLHSNEAQPPN